MPRKPKPTAPGSPVDIESMIRVDHAGEYGAVRIYEGQLAVLRRRGSASVATIESIIAAGVVSTRESTSCWRSLTTSFTTRTLAPIRSLLRRIC